ncbi:MAG: hypothetical protein LBU68_00135, partial [Rickettsiales bacterium]|nr:hypothetical protein [Rickettsiales bacterium]
MLLRKKAFLNLFMICTFFATFLSFSVEITAAISKGFNNGNVSRARRLARPITLTAAGSLINENIPEESAEPTREQYNQYYQQINELNECVRRSCLSNSRSPIPGACFNATVVDSKIENNCKAQFNTIKVLHPSFELQAVIDVKTKLLADSKKACDGLNGSYSGGNPPNPYDGQFMSFGDCSIKVGYAPETLNKGENYAVRNVRVMDIGDSRACNMSSFGVNASDMLSDGNEKAAINMDIKMYGALASLGVEALGATGKVLVAQDFVKKNGQCVCTKELCGRGRRAVQNGNPYPVEEDDPPITKAECDAPEGEYAMDGFKWLDNFDKQMQAAGKERDTAYEALVSGCYQEKDSTGSSNMNAAAEIYMNSNNLSYADQENIMKEMELVGMSTPPSVLYKTQNNTPTIFSLESKIDGKLVVDPTSKLITAPGSSNNGKKLATTEVAKYLDSSTEKEECLCVATNKDFSYYEPWDNNTVMCFYNDNSVANIRIGKRGKNNIATYVEPAATPMVPGMSNAEGLTNASFTNAWQVGAIEAAEGAYSDAMLTQYV